MRGIKQKRNKTISHGKESEMKLFGVEEKILNCGFDDIYIAKSEQEKQDIIGRLKNEIKKLDDEQHKEI